MIGRDVLKFCLTDLDPRVLHPKINLNRPCYPGSSVVEQRLVGRSSWVRFSSWALENTEFYSVLNSKFLRLLELQHALRISKSKFIEPKILEYPIFLSANISFSKRFPRSYFVFLVI